ncbi:hypothetical protein QQS21_003929 [Conoideocrella luteorostrata]|uniref:Pierisin-like domain-containing protein n=1 Tax=Conoideocrella luteorostrata TaxID=1105319 RepID=A0AAJ0FV57_9HYPO|nr:hypothetical protein QQS21_003929 [Conoideocrella luteorostrata]
MVTYQLLALLAGWSMALAQIGQAQTIANKLPSNITDALDISPTLFGETVFSIIDDNSEERNTHELATSDDHLKVSKRQNPRKIFLSFAEEASKHPVPFGGRTGVFFRGDSRPPSEVFKHGFQPLGTNTNLISHLSFQTPSGLVSLTRSHFAAQKYAFGRPADNNKIGYVYVIAHTDVPRGFWVPGLFDPEKNPAVAMNQEFAVAGAVPGSSIAYAYEMKADKPFSEAKRIKNDNFISATSPGCLWKRKRAACNPTAGIYIEDEPMPKPNPTEEGSQQKNPNGPGEESHESPRNKGRPANTAITQSRFMQFLVETDVNFMAPIIESIKNDEASARDYQLALKRALSETMDKRWTDFSSTDAAIATVSKIGLDLVSTARFAIPRGYLEDVIKSLPAIAKEISQARTHEEKLKIANRNINTVMKIWEHTPIGALNEYLMNLQLRQESRAIHATLNQPRDVARSAPADLNQLWSYTPLGWIISRFVPVEPLLKKINVREDYIKYGLIR